MNFLQLILFILFVHRLRYLLRQLNRGEISAETLQKNLQYAAKVLEAVYIDETKYVSYLFLFFLVADEGLKVEEDDASILDIRKMVEGNL